MGEGFAHNRRVPCAAAMFVHEGVNKAGAEGRLRDWSAVAKLSGHSLACACGGACETFAHAQSNQGAGWPSFRSMHMCRPDLGSCCGLTPCAAAAATELLLADGSQEHVNGHCLFRAHLKKEGVWILSIIYKGAPTHHQIQANDAGVLAINKKVPRFRRPADPHA